MKLKNYFMLVLCMMILSNTCYAYQNINVNTMWERVNQVFSENSKIINKEVPITEQVYIFTRDMELFEYNDIRNYPTALQATHCYSSNYVDKLPVRPFGNDLWLLCNENNDVRQLMFHITYISDTESYKDGYVTKYRRNLRPYFTAVQILQCLLISFGETDTTTLKQADSFSAEAYNKIRILLEQLLLQQEKNIYVLYIKELRDWVCLFLVLVYQCHRILN
ncbi:MAG: hypothetical protein ACI377_04205 [Bacteroides fragilis]